MLFILFNVLFCTVVFYLVMEDTFGKDWYTRWYNAIKQTCNELMLFLWDMFKFVGVFLLLFVVFCLPLGWAYYEWVEPLLPFVFN